MKTKQSTSFAAFRSVVVSIVTTAGVALALSLAFQVGRAPTFFQATRDVAARLGLLGDTRAESGTDLDGDTYASIASGGTDCYDSLQAQYSDFPNSSNACDSTDNAVTFDADKPGPTDVPIADHSWIKDDAGLWHLFFQNNDTTEKIEHFTSASLQNDLSYVGQALTPGTGTWDEQLWAPFVMKNGDTYYMFYTGVTNSGTASADYQRIGVATATSLNGTWTRNPSSSLCSGTTGNGCVYDCNETWTTWGNGGAWERQCRDPFVIRDEANNRWLMFMTARPNVGGTWSDTFVTVASSTDLLNWDGVGYIKATKKLSAGEGGVGAQTTGSGLAENSFITKFNNTYYLFFTDWSDDETTVGAMIQYVKSSSLNVDASGSTNWTYVGNHPQRGVNAMEVVQPFADTWIMSQSMSNNEDGDLTPQFVWRDLIWNRAVWNSNDTYTLSKLTNLSCRVASNTIKPGGTEICSDNVDQNCSGTADEALYCAACTDADGDGYGTSGLNNCAQTQVDCDDQRATAKPGGSETCDSVDNDCDGAVDEGNVCPTPCTENWSCTAWTLCEDAKKTRTCLDANACGTTTNKPETSQTCTVAAPETPAPPAACREQWSCSDWAACAKGSQTRICTDANSCGTTSEQPATLKSCIVPAEEVLIALPKATNDNVAIYAPDGTVLSQFRPFTAKTGTFSVAAGDVDGDDETDIVAGSGPSSQPVIRVFSDKGQLRQSFTPFSSWVKSGVQVSVGDIDGNNLRDIVAVPGPGSPASVVTFSYNAASQRFIKQSTFTPLKGWRKGLTMQLADLDSDSRSDLIVLPNGERTPRLRIYEYDPAARRWKQRHIFSLGAARGQPALTAGDLNGDGVREILVGAGPGAAPRIRVFNQTGKLLHQFLAGSKSDRSGILLTTLDYDNDGRDEIVVTRGTGRKRNIRFYELAENGRSFRLERQFSDNRLGDKTRDLQSPQ